MSLEIRKSSKWWYGVFVVDGRKTVINLGIPITGQRPPKRTMLGDDEFELIGICFFGSVERMPRNLCGSKKNE